MLETILLVTIPLLIFSGVVLLILQQQTRRMLAEQQKALRQHALGAVVPLMIGAMERATLYVDRVRPENLLARHAPATHPSAKSFADALLEDIRAEYEHNAVQQLYLSEKTWNQVVACRDYALKLVLESGSTLTGDKPSGLDLAHAIKNQHDQQAEKPFPLALQLLRRELKRLLQN